MSKTSSKNRYTQLMSWLETRKQTAKRLNPQNSPSKLTHYKNKLIK